MQRIPPELTANARALRLNATDAEKRLWLHLCQRRPRFTRQLVVSHYNLDFACRSLKLPVELDGGQHADQGEADARRTAHLEAQGWRVLRFWNNDVLSNVDGVIAVIMAAVERESTVERASTHPQPLPFREGS